ncbi:FAD-dependent oxidoreductase [Nostocoides veronense]|uniref:FAD-dependent oxidoreductase n=1 Tax=Nostocoides veronense TaxID=330836 RepID=A0ABN2LP01_9MICO
MPIDLPARARVVIIGGGVIGSSIAYHLAHAGWTDVVVLERDRLTSGTTWHAAGLMTTFGSTSETSTDIRLYGRDLYARLEAETGVATGFKAVGLIEAAADADRLEEYRRVAAFQRRLDLEIHEIGPREMSELFPLAKTDDLLAGFYVPGDGRVNPVDLTMSLARGARNLGVRIIEGVSAEKVLTRPGVGGQQVVGVATSAGDIEAEYVVNCAGMWAREVAARNGVIVPNQAAEHYYLITEPIAGMSPDAPVFEDPAAYGYYREEGGGMMVGLFEPRAAAWAVDGIPRDFSFGTLPPDWERMGPFVERAMARVPATLDVGIRTFFCGPESFTPDLLPAVGEAPGVRGYFVCAGMNSVGILSSGGWGKVMAHWITTGAPDVDITAVNVDRFRDYQLDPAYREQRTAEILGTVYAAHTPGIQLTTGRGINRSPVHDRLVAAGAYLRDVSGWESADWYAGQGLSPSAEPGWGHQPWFAQWRAEHTAVRERVGLIDMSFMAKWRVTGPDASAVLDWLSAGAVAERDGRITYTQWLDDDARLQADLTVTRLSEQDFLVVASDTAYGHVENLLHQAAAGRDVALEDVTTTLAQFALQGPNSRATLAGLTEADLSNDIFPFRTAARLTLAGRDVILARITYAGELGYEIYVPNAEALAVWDAIMEAGAPHGLSLYGLKALASLRMEKGYRDYGHDIDNTDGVYEAGLGFAVALDKGDFRGREVAAQARTAPARRRIVSVLLRDPASLLFHAEPVLRDGEFVGYLRAASYGWTLGGAVGLAMVEAPEAVTTDWLDTGTWEVDVAGRCVPAMVSLRPLYDARSERIRS